MINDLSKRCYFSKFDWRNAYHQIPLHPHDMNLIAFEANGRLFNNKRIRFRLTNTVRAYQRTINQIIK